MWEMIVSRRSTVDWSQCLHQSYQGFCRLWQRLSNEQKSAEVRSPACRHQQREVECFMQEEASLALTRLGNSAIPPSIRR